MEIPHTEYIHRPIVGKGNVAVDIVETQTDRHCHEHPFQFVALISHLVARLLQASPQHHQIGQIL